MNSKRSWLLAARHSLITAEKETNSEANSHSFSQAQAYLSQKYYKCFTDKFHSYELESVWLELKYDSETKDFMEECERDFNSIIYGVKSFISSMIIKCCFIDNTTVNGLLNRGHMFVLSSQHFKQILEHSLSPSFLNSWFSVEKFQSKKRLLDVGAGDGNVTKKLAPFFEEVVATEVCSPMISRLQNHGFKAVETDTLNCSEKLGRELFDMVSILNVLDRCSMPISLLKQAKKWMIPTTGLLLLAVVFPFEPFAQGSCGEQLTPKENIADWMIQKIDPQDEEYEDSGNMDFETSVQRFVHYVLKPLELKVLCVSRVPYLCKGDIFQTYYVLDNAIFLCTFANTITNDFNDCSSISNIPFINNENS